MAPHILLIKTIIQYKMKNKTTTQREIRQMLSIVCGGSGKKAIMWRYWQKGKFSMGKIGKIWRL